MNNSAKSRSVNPSGTEPAGTVTLASRLEPIVLSRRSGSIASFTSSRKPRNRSNREASSPSSQSRSRGSSSNRSDDSDRYSNRNDSRYSNDNDRGWSRYEYYRAPSHAYRGWDRGRNYSWNNHDYRWHGGSWVIITPGYDYSGNRRNTVSYSNRSDVRQVQALLTRRGYSPGPIDGDMGYRTSRAIEQFQSDRGLAVTGRIDRDLLVALDRG